MYTKRVKEKILLAGSIGAVISLNRGVIKVQTGKVKNSSDRLVIVAKGFLKLPNLHMLIKQKSPLLTRFLALLSFGELLTVFSAKINLLHLIYSTDQRC